MMGKDIRLPVTVTQFKVRWDDGNIDEVYIEKTGSRSWAVVGSKGMRNEYDGPEAYNDALGDINCLWWEYWEHLLDEDRPGVLLEFNRRGISERWNRAWLSSVRDQIQRAHCKLEPSGKFIRPVRVRSHRRRR